MHSHSERWYPTLWYTTLLTRAGKAQRLTLLREAQISAKWPREGSHRDQCVLHDSPKAGVF
jgi:hypothetical protein